MLDREDASSTLNEIASRGGRGFFVRCDVTDDGSVGSAAAQSHRLATLRNFDRVVMLKAGKIIEDGSPDRLMRGQGPYRELVTQEMKRRATHAA